MRTKRFILASVFDPIADLRMAVEQIKREPKPQPDMVPWDEYQPRIMLARETWLTLERFRRVMHWRNRKRGKRRAYFAMKSGCALVAPGVPRGRALAADREPQIQRDDVPDRSEDEIPF